MSSLYPSLEDMKVDQMHQAEESYRQAAISTAHAIAYPDAPVPEGMPAGGSMAPGLYPSLNDYMGLSLTPDMIQQTMPVVAANQGVQGYPAQNTQVAQYAGSMGQMQVAPISGSSVGLKRAEIKSGVREIILCKDAKGMMGLRVRSINKGVFVAFVHKDSPAALAGLRFGDQILQINNETVAGWDTDKTMKYLKNCAPERITMAVRDRPFERTITMQKDSTGHIGFVFKDGQIKSIVKDSSAARNGVLIEHHLVEVDGQNVVGIKDKEIGDIFQAAGRTVTITIIPSFIYEHILKNIGSSLVKKFMDHSIPDV